MLSVFVKSERLNSIASVRSQTAGVGVMGVMGNKGGAAIRFRLNDTTICMVAAHLAAHRDNIAGRNADFANILLKTRFSIVRVGNGDGVVRARLAPFRSPLIVPAVLLG
jgi:phosphatidylinositol-bisphosphatase